MQLRSAFSHMQQVIVPDLLGYLRQPSIRWVIAAAVWLLLMGRVFGRSGKVRRRFLEPVDLLILGVVSLVTWYAFWHRWW